jgi:hypothetical protein
MLVLEMQENEAMELLEARVADGSSLIVVAHATLQAVKKLRDQCLEADIPAMLGPCAPGG